MIYLYILYSKKIDKYYVGISNNPEQRLRYHNLGKKGWTKRGIPWVLLFQKAYSEKSEALRIEKYIKKQKSIKFINKIIIGEYML